MALYEDVNSSIKSKNKKFNNAHIRNLKIMNVLNVLMFGFLCILDLVFIIKNASTGTNDFVKITMPLFMVLEVLAMLVFIARHFSRAGIHTKVALTVVYSLPFITYFGAIAVSSGYAWLLIGTRIVAVGALAMLLYNTKSTENNKIFMIKGLPLCVASLVSLVAVFILLAASNDRHIIYAYDHTLKGDVVADILDGSGKVKFKEGIVGITADSLKNAPKSITLPSSVVYVDEDAFNGSNVKEVTISSKNIQISDALYNSKVEKVILLDDNTNLDIDKKLDCEFITSKESINEYRKLYNEYDYLFSPVVDKDEVFVCYDGVQVDVKFVNKGTLIEEPSYTIDNTNQEIIFTGWKINNQAFTYPYRVENSVHIKAGYNNVYKVNYKFNDQAVIDESSLIKKYYEDLGDITLPEAELDGYKFMGWFDTDTTEKLEKLSSIENDIELEAKFSKIFKLSYSTGIGEVPEDAVDEYVVEDTFELPKLESEGFEFMGWYDESHNLISNIDDLNGDAELTAKWDLADVTFESEIEDITQVYDGNEYSVTINPIHPLDVTKTYEWTKDDNPDIVSNKNKMTFVNVVESGNYNCKIRTTYTVIDSNGKSLIFDHVTNKQVVVTINPAKYDMNCTFNDVTIDYDGYLHNDFRLEGELPIGIDHSKPSVEFVGGFKDADTGTIEAVFTAGSSNYENPESLFATLTIRQKVVTLNWGSTKFTYAINSETGRPIEYKPSVNLVGVLEDDLCEATVTGGANYAGSHRAYVMSLSNSNYKLPEVNYIDFIISKSVANLNVTYNPTQVFEYDGKEHKPILNGIPADAVTTYSITNIINAGEYVVTVNVKVDRTNESREENYPVTVVVNPKELNITCSQTTFTYDGLEHYPTLTITNKVDGDLVTINNNNPSSRDAGNYRIEVLSINNDNYKLPEINYFDYKIEKADYVMTGIGFTKSSYEYDYNGEFRYPVFNSALPTGMDDIQLKATFENVAKNTGEYIVNVTFTTTSQNYNVPQKMSANVKINPIVAQISWGTTVFDYKKDVVQKPTATVANLIGSDQCTVIVTGGQTDAGEDYVAEVGGLSGNNNYVLPAGLISTLFTILPSTDADIIIIFGNEDGINEYVYNGKEQRPTAIIEGPDAEYFQIKDYVYPSGIRPINVGSYQVTVVFSADEGHVAPADITIVVNITEKVLGINWGNQVFTYNGELQLPNPKPVTADVVPGDNVSIISDTISGDSISAGNHTIKAIDVTNRNYKLSSDESDLEYTYKINKARYDIQSVRFENTTVTYNGEYQIPRLVHNIPSFDDSIFTYENTIGAKNVYSNHKVTFTIKSNSDNYEPIDPIDSYITVNKKTITLVWGETSFVYNGEEQIPTCNVLGLVGNDKCNLTVTGKYINVGLYTATAQSIDNVNYQLPDSGTKQAFEIIPADLDLSISFENTKVSYNGLEQFPTVIGLTDGVTVSYSETPINAKKYSLIATFDVSENYNPISNKTVEFEITPKALNFTWRDTSATYTGSEITPRTRLTGKLGEDECDVVLSGLGTDVGTYTVKIDRLTNSNYVLPQDLSKYDLEFEIIPADYELGSIKFEDKSYIYDGQPHTPVLSGSFNAGIDNTLPTVASISKGATDVEEGYVTVTVTFTTTSKNYNAPKPLEAKVWILPKEVSIVWSGLESDYNGEIHTPTATVASSSLIGDDDVKVVVTGGNNVAGTHTAQAISLSDSNYKLPTDTKKDYIIHKADYDLSKITNLTQVLEYNGTTQYPSIPEFDNIVGLDGIKPTVSFDKGAKNVSDGIVDIVATFDTLSENYNIPGDITFKLSITPMSVDVTFEYDVPVVKDNNSTKVLSGNDVSVEYDGLEHGILVKYSANLYDTNVVFSVDGKFKNYQSAKYQFVVESNNSNYLPATTKVSVSVGKHYIWYLPWDSTTLTPQYSLQESQMASNFVIEHYIQNTTTMIDYNPLEAHIVGDYTAKLKTSDPSVSISDQVSHNYSYKVKASDVVSDIANLPAAENVTIDDKDTIDNIRANYNSLSENDKKSVTNLSKLEACEEKLNNTIVITFVNDASNKAHSSSPNVTATATGNMNSKATALTYDGNSYTTALKMETNTNITVNCSETYRMIIVTDAGSKALKVNGVEKTTNADGAIIMDSVTGTIEITKKDGPNIYAIILEKLN